MPTTVKKLSQDQEAQLAAALTKVADAVNSGESPNDAIAHVVAQDKLPAGHVGLLANAFNTGRSIGQIKQGRSREEKASSFTLANTKTILDKLYPDKPQTRAEKQAQAAVSDDYRQAPSSLFHRKNAFSAMLKTARDNRTNPTRVLPVSDTGEWVKKASAKAELQRTAENHDLAFTGAGFRTAAAIDRLSTYFKQAGCEPFDQVYRNVSAGRSPEWRKLLDCIAEKNPGLRKQASARSCPAKWSEAPYTLIRDCLDHLAQFGQHKEAKDKFRAENAEALGGTQRPFARQSLNHGSIWKEAGDLAAMGLGALTMSAGKNLASRLSPDHEQQVAKQESLLDDPAHAKKMQAIGTRTALLEMMAEDPVISGFDPADVTAAYNRLSEVAPRAMQRHAIASAVLGKYLAQGQKMDQFDLMNLLQGEQGAQQLERAITPSL
jgi:hypothetical protein